MAGVAVLGQTAVREPAVPIAVSVRHVEMAYPDLKAVDDVSFELGSGAFLDHPRPVGLRQDDAPAHDRRLPDADRGDIVIAGEPVRAVPPWRRSIGMVFQRLALFPHLTAADNVAFPLRMRRFDARTIAERVERYLELVRLGGLGAPAHPRAVRRPAAAGGDRPGAGLRARPAAARRAARRARPQAPRGDAARVPPHPARARRHHHQRHPRPARGADHVRRDHRHGQAAGCSRWARPTATYRAPANPFVAGFIGVTNFLSGDVRGSGDGAVMLAVGDTLDWRARPAPAPLAAGAPADAALRAEQIRIAAIAEALGRARDGARGTVADVIFEGERRGLRGAGAGARRRDASRLRPRSCTSMPASPPARACSSAGIARDLLVFAR